jgi:hypothetical protein
LKDYLGLLELKITAVTNILKLKQIEKEVYDEKIN